MVVMLMVPGALYMYQLQLVALNTVISQCGFAVFAMSMLYAISHYMQRMAGIILINEAQDQVTIAHMDFWGRRHNEIIPVSSVMPFRDTGDQRGERLVYIKLYDSDQYYIIDRRRGQFVDKQLFVDAFGEFK